MPPVIPLLIAGLPGKMALETAQMISAGEQAERRTNSPLELIAAISSPARHGQACTVNGRPWTLVGADHRDDIELADGVMAIDYSTPDSALPNAAWYVSRKVPFVMGTTGYDSAALKRLLSKSEISAVVAPNMAAPVVMLQAAMRWLAAEFPGACAGAGLSVRESHQQGKRDTSGTARALVASFRQLGIEYTVDQIDKVRDPWRQINEIGVPAGHLDGHAFHRYELGCAGGTVKLALEHNVVGRRAYAEGTLIAVRFLAARLKSGSRGELFSMEDVLSGSAELD